MGQIVNKEKDGRFKLRLASMVDLLFTKQEKPAWGTNVVILEQVCRGKQREDALCLKIKMER